MPPVIGRKQIVPGEIEALTKRAAIPPFSNTASWSSAFWALVPVALHSMVQPAGKCFRHHERDQCYALHTSPIICASDAIYFLACVVYYSYSIGPPHKALKLVVKTRYRNVDRGG